MSDHKRIFFDIHEYQPEPLKRVRYEAINYDQLFKAM